MFEDETKKSYSAAKSFAARRLAQQSLNSHKLRKKLIEKGFEEEAEKVVEEFQEAGYINDRAYAESLIRREARLCRGPKLIAEKLVQLGMNRDEAYELIDSNYTLEDQKEQALQLVSKKKKETSFKEKQRLFGILYRNGFSSSLIGEVMSDWESDV